MHSTESRSTIYMYFRQLSFRHCNMYGRDSFSAHAIRTSCLLSLFCKKGQTSGNIKAKCQSVCVPLLNKLLNFHETSYDTRGYVTFALLISYHHQCQPGGGTSFWTGRNTGATLCMVLTFSGNRPSKNSNFCWGNAFVECENIDSKPILSFQFDGNN